MVIEVKEEKVARRNTEKDWRIVIIKIKTDKSIKEATLISTKTHSITNKTCVIIKSPHLTIIKTYKIRIISKNIKIKLTKKGDLRIVIENWKIIIIKIEIAKGQNWIKIKIR